MSLREDVSDRAKRRVGSVVKGKYRLDRVLGIGGMATVYAATHRNKKRFAVKMLHPEIALDKEITQRFTREGYVANAVGHPGTVEVFDDDVTEDGAPFLVMELLLGETLDARFERKGQRLPATEVLPVVSQLLEVLVSAHANGIVHRDLKPENLLLTTDGRLKVLDFGIARLREVQQTGSDIETRAGSLLGTPAFMAPEQARGRWEEVDGRTDVWAVGAVLFNMLSGRFVHEGETLNEQIIMAATVPAPSIATFMPTLAPVVVELIDRALAFHKDERWPDAGRMLAAVRAAAHDISGSVDSLPLPAPSVLMVEQETLIAPSEMTPIPFPKPETLTTARAITSGAPVTTPTKAPRRAVWFAAAGAALTVLGLMVFTATRADTRPETGTATPEAPTTPTALPTAPVVDTAPAVEPAHAAPSSPDAGTKGLAAGQERGAPHAKSVGAGREDHARVPTAPGPSAGPPTDPPPVGKGLVGPRANPFDRRH